MASITSIPAAYNAEQERQQNIIGRQIAAARKMQGMSLNRFRMVLEAYGVSVTNAAINKWELGGSSPNAYQLLAISQALGFGEDLSFFMGTTTQKLNQEGLRKLAEYRSDLIATGRYTPQPERKSVIRYIEMPVSDLPVSAGVGAFLEEEHFEMVRFPEQSVPAGADFGVRISGNSMEPVYHDGQIVWVQQCDRVPLGQVGVFICDGDGYLKVYQEQEPAEDVREDFITSDGVLHPQPVMLSYNPDYAPRVVSACTEFHVVGRVL